MKNNKKLLLSLAISTALFGTSSYAEDAATAAANDDDDSNVILVTAQKRSERLSEVPISMSVFPEEAIDQTGIQELRELAEFIPNVLITQGTDFNSRILIRGVGAPSRNIGFDSRVGVYLDGVYLGQGPAVNQDLVDLERVEVLRGPQGTLFGKNTVAGAISMVSKKPGDEFEAKATVNFANLNGIELRANVNVPITDTFTAKFAGSTRQRDGYIDNVWSADKVPTNMVIGVDPNTGAPIIVPIAAVIAGSFDPAFAAFGFPPHPTHALGPDTPPTAPNDLNNQDTQSWRAQFRYQPSEALDINLSLDGLTSDRRPVLGVNITDTFGAFAEVDAPQADQVSWSNPGREKRDIKGGALDITYNMANEFTLKSITSNRVTKINYQNDTDYGAIDWVHLNYEDKYDQTTQEFQIISPDDAAFKYVVGVYYYNQDSDTLRDVFNGNAAIFFSDFANFNVNYPGTTTSNRGTVNTESTAAYLSGSYQLNEQWKLGFGVRYTTETKKMDWALDGSHSGLFGIATTPAGGIQDKRKDTDWSPTVSLNYAYNDYSNIYVKYSTGFKSGGFNLDFIDPTALADGIRFDKETVTSYELGLKTSLLDDRLTLNMAYFDASYDDYQVNQFFSLGINNGVETTSIRIRNAASVSTNGIELEAVFRVTDDLTINGSLGTLDATFDSFPNGASPRDPITGVKAPVVDADGNKLPGAADLNASLGIQYYKRIEKLDSDLLVRLDVTYTGDYFTTIENVKSRGLNGTRPGNLTFDTDFTNPNFGQTSQVPFGFVKGYALLNGRIGLIDGQGSWEVYLWGRNLTDENQYVDSFREFFGTLVNTPQTPRTYGIEASYNF